jgi:hypothetical protein
MTRDFDLIVYGATGSGHADGFDPAQSAGGARRPHLQRALRPSENSGIGSAEDLKTFARWLLRC